MQQEMAASGSAGVASGFSSAPYVYSLSNPAWTALVPIAYRVLTTSTSHLTIPMLYPTLVVVCLQPEAQSIRAAEEIWKHFLQLRDRKKGTSYASS